MTDNGEVYTEQRAPADSDFDQKVREDVLSLRVSMVLVSRNGGGKVWVTHLVKQVPPGKRSDVLGVSSGAAPPQTRPAREAPQSQ